MNTRFESVREALGLIREIQNLDDQSLRDRLYQLVMAELDQAGPPPPPPPAPPEYVRTEKHENGRVITSFRPDSASTPSSTEGRELIGSQRAITREPFQPTGGSPRKAPRRSTTPQTTKEARLLKILQHFPEGVFASELSEVVDDPDLKGRVPHILSSLHLKGQIDRSRGRMIGKDVAGRNISMYKYFPKTEGGEK